MLLELKLTSFECFSPSGDRDEEDPVEHSGRQHLVAIKELHQGQTSGECD